MMNTKTDSACLDSGRTLAACADPLCSALHWFASHEPLVRMLAVTHRAVTDPAVYVPAAVRMVFAQGAPSWRLLGLSTAHDAHRFATVMAQVNALLERMEEWTEPALSEALDHCTAGDEADKLRPWLRILVFGEHFEYELSAALVALGREQALQHLRASMEAFKRACMVG